MPDSPYDESSIKQQIALGVLQEKVDAASIRLERIEEKIDKQHYVSINAFDAYRADADKRYVTQDQFKPLKWFFYTAGGAIVTGVVGALVLFGLNGGLK